MIFLTQLCEITKSKLCNSTATNLVHWIATSPPQTQTVETLGTITQLTPINLSPEAQLGILLTFVVGQNQLTPVYKDNLLRNKDTNR